MPATAVQTDIARILASNRSAWNCYFGSFALFHTDGRDPKDLDIFCPASEHEKIMAADIRRLHEHGYEVRNGWGGLDYSSMYAVRGNDRTKIDWLYWPRKQFFEPVKHRLYGACAHPFDIAMQKFLTVLPGNSDRSVVFGDLFFLHEHGYDLGAVFFAVATARSSGICASMLEQIRHWRDLYRLRTRPTAYDQLLAESYGKLAGIIDPLVASADSSAAMGRVFLNEPGEILVPGKDDLAGSRVLEPVDINPPPKKPPLRPDFRGSTESAATLG